MGHRVLVVALVVTLAACGSSGSVSSNASTVTVVTTTTQLADFARVVGGDRVTVTGLLRPNVDAHEFEPAPADIERVRTARVVVRNGLGLDGWVDRAIEASGTTATVIDASTGVTTRDEDGHTDPHVWLDPRNAATMVATLAAALVAADPAGKADYEGRRDAYLGEIDVLDRAIAAQLAPIVNRKVVTNHDAFGYFLDRYGLELVGSVIPSFDSQAEPSATDLRQLVDAIRAAGVNAIFVEASLPPKAAEAVAREAGVRVVDAALYGDSLGPAGSGAETYLTMMRTNATTLAENLQ